MNNYQVECPRNYIAQNVNATYLQNLKVSFYDYVNNTFLPGCVITNIVPLDGNVKPICAWQIFFNYNPAVQKGSFKQIKFQLERNKPRNSDLKSLRMIGISYYCAEYSVVCACKPLDFCLIDETNSVNSKDVIDNIKKFVQLINVNDLSDMIVSSDAQKIECGFFKVIECSDICGSNHLSIEWHFSEQGLYAVLNDCCENRCEIKSALTNFTKTLSEWMSMECVD